VDSGLHASHADAVKGLLAPPSTGRKTATAIVRGRPEQSAELWKPCQLYSRSFCRRQRMGGQRKRAAAAALSPRI